VFGACSWEHKYTINIDKPEGNKNKKEKTRREGTAITTL
jgi:hypothetical protein